MHANKRGRETRDAPLAQARARVSVKTLAFTKNHVKALKIANGSTIQTDREKEREDERGGTVVVAWNFLPSNYECISSWWLYSKAPARSIRTRGVYVLRIVKLATYRGARV